MFHPGYEYQYQLEQGYPTLGYHPDWSIEDVRYMPQNLRDRVPGACPTSCPQARTYALGPLFQPDEPVCTEPGATRGLFDRDCPLALPIDIGTSLLLTSPAYLLLLPTLRRWGRSRLVTGGVIAIVLIVLLDLAHFSQGWVQWGYRFSLDFVAVRPAAGRARRTGPRRSAAARRLRAGHAVGADQPVGRDLGRAPGMVRRRRRG